MKTWKSAVFVGAMLVMGGISVAKASVTGDGRGPMSALDPSEYKLAAKDKDRAISAKHPPLNACGCYAKDNACVCTTRVMKCDCPGECEPVGCEAKRQKQIERELAEETKRIQEENKKREEAEKAKLAAQAPKVEEDDGEEEEVKPVKGKGSKAADKPAEKAEGKRGDKSEGKPSKAKSDAPEGKTE